MAERIEFNYPDRGWDDSYRALDKWGDCKRINELTDKEHYRLVEVDE